MKRSALVCFSIAVLTALCGCDKDLVCDPDVPVLTEQSGHLAYYFPDREALGPLANGTYAGRIVCGITDCAKVTLTVEDDVITDCEVVYLLMSKYLMDAGLDDDVLEIVPDRFLEAQSLDFDAITGATGSTHAFKICAARALWKAAGKEDPMRECVPVRCR